MLWGWGTVLLSCVEIFLRQPDRRELTTLIAQREISIAPHRVLLSPHRTDSSKLFLTETDKEEAETSCNKSGRCDESHSVWGCCVIL